MISGILESRTVVGIDIGRRWIKLAQRVRRGGAWAMGSTAVLPRVGSGPMPDSVEAELVASAVRRLGFAGHRVAVALPAELARIDTLEVPPRSSGAPVEAIAQQELARTRSLEPGSFEFRCWDLPKGRRGRDGLSVMAVSCGSAQVEELLGRFEAVGLDVCRLDVQPWALVRACGLVGAALVVGAESGEGGASPGGSSVGVVVDIGHSAARVMVSVEGVVLYVGEQAGLGVERVVAALRAEHGLGDEHARALLFGSGAATWSARAEVAGVLARHREKTAAMVRESLAFATQRQGTIGQATVVLVGGGASLPGMAGGIEQELGKEVRVVAGCAGDVIGPACDPVLAGAIGMAVEP